MRLLHLFASSPVKKTNSLLVLALCTMLSGCFAPMLAVGPSQLMWAFIKPFVGLDPSSSQLFEKPMIKNRMTALLGEDYEETLALLRTAPKLQQEGALFYLASPTEDGEAQAAGLVWNAQTNKMSAIVNDGQETKLFNEPNSTVPVVWPKTLQTLVAPTKKGAAKASFSGQSTAVAGLTDTEQQLKAAQAQLKALQDQAELQSVQAQIKALQSKAALEASNKAAVKAKVKTDVETEVKTDVKTEVKTKVQLENKAGLNIETTTATKKVNAQ
ncbi:hypothetical protein [Oceanisphaera sp. IT1-181]|uniref:hypothetical protein n=1 Tax=Oceanisphaera sp. IT1-181 TaxID=3081199 RepID=UPI0029CA0217|nr:hypothetical protein [Oceanisphaera sp. IT1-181]